MKEKWIVVTGASSGIGKVTAEYLLENDYSVVVTSRNKEMLQKTFDNHDKSKFRIIEWDLSKIETIKDYAKTVKTEVGAISGLVHCAGIQKTMPVHMIKPEKIYGIFNLNTFAAISLVSAFAKKNMYVPEETSFILISSIAAHEGAKGNSLYAASKGALEGFVADVSCELVEKGIRINAIAPGQVQTEMTDKFFENADPVQLENAKEQYPMGFGKPEDIAYYIEFLLSIKSRWINGRTNIIDGGHLVRQCY